VSEIQVRRFRRDDRVQLTALVNAHVAAVMPGVTVSVNTVLSQLERDPGEFIVDPWVGERLTLVAEQRQRIVAAAHLIRYRADDDVGPDFRNAGEIKWFLFWPPAPYWPDGQDADDELMAACLATLQTWGCDPLYADGSLPSPGVYGIPGQWPHVAQAYERAGFEHGGRVEVVLVADVGELAGTGAGLEGVSVRRSVGINGTRLTASEGETELGFIEVEVGFGAAGRQGTSTWADIGNLEIDEAHRGRGVGRWLVGQAAQWLQLGRVDRLIAYSGGDEDPCLGYLLHAGFSELTRTRRGWTKDVSS
jgi:GNAT superfamily N-acetyltransferase